jgi:hypothetical protein
MNRSQTLKEVERIASTYAPGDLPTPNDSDPKRKADGLLIQQWQEAKEADDSKLKKELLALAKSGAPRPKPNTRLGKALARFTTKD